MKIHNLQQGTTEWQAFRLSHHGASEAAAMLGLSKKTTRSELLHMKHTGTPKEFSDWVQKNVLDYGHEVEDKARPIIEGLIGEDLYPVTTSNEDEGGNLSASCDGLTMTEDTAFEHKQWAAELAASVEAGILPEEHMPQCQQIMLVTGAQRVIFTVSDGTQENCVHMEVFPDESWFDRIRAGWAQFDRDLENYTPPEPIQPVVGDPVQDLPAVAVQVSGQIDVRDNFKAFETALRDFLETRLIREPETDQDFANLDLQIKALKKAEDALNSAETMMLAQIQSVDEAKRQKDMLSKLVRENRLMAEKLLASEKTRRREEKVAAARKLFFNHVAGLQREITGLRLDVPIPDFASAIKGLKTLDSIQDRLDTALANGKIEADRLAADLREKLSWVDANAAEYRALLADIQQLAIKPLDDFQLAITSRINSHKEAEAKKLETERERIRKEEADRLEREAREKQEQEAATPPLAAPVAPALALVGLEAAPAADPVIGNVVLKEAKEEVTAGRTLRLGQINELLSPITLSADGLAALGFLHVATEKNAKLYRESDMQKIYAALVRHVQAVSKSQIAA